jgi:hypothetical protein
MEPQICLWQLMFRAIMLRHLSDLKWRRNSLALKNQRSNREGTCGFWVGGRRYLAEMQSGRRMQSFYYWKGRGLFCLIASREKVGE